MILEIIDIWNAVIKGSKSKRRNKMVAPLRYIHDDDVICIVINSIIQLVLINHRVIDCRLWKV